MTTTQAAPPPPPSDMPDVTDTGTIIGSIKLQHQPLEPASPILVTEDGNDTTMMQIDSNNNTNNAAAAVEEDEEEEEDALQTIEKLRSDDLSARVEAARKLPSIALALGPERTRDELLPFLSDGIDDEDEVLEAIAVSLGGLVPHVGGADYASSLLTPLELLLAVEESVVREKAAASVIVISQSLSGADYTHEFVGMIGRLANKEWFTARISACTLIAHAFPKMGPELRRTHLEYFAKLCKDDVPMVRRIASKNLGTLFYTVVDTLGAAVFFDKSNANYSLTLLDLYELLAGGDQPDSVRLHTTENCVCFGRAMALMLEQSSSTSLEKEEIMSRIDALVKRILPLIAATIDDRSWRVRWTAASKFADVVHAFKTLHGAMDALVPNYEKLLQDPEAEVRTAATYNLSEVAKTKAMVCPAGWSGAGSDSDNGMDIDDDDDENKNTHRIPVAQRLVTRLVGLTEDDSVNVRAALAMVATELAPLLGKDASVSNLLPPMLLLLRDSSSEVRLNIISSLSLLNDVIGTDLLHQSLLPAILDLADDGKWRIRLAVIERIPLLAKQLGSDFFDDRLLGLCVGWLGDDISSIREAAAKNLQELTALLGTEWSVQNLFPRVRQVMEHPSYLRRMNAVQATALMATAMDVNSAQVEVLPILLEMHYDPVPNVRFNVAKGLGIVGTVFDRSVYQGQIVPILTLMENDPDRDVRYFASKTKELLSVAFEKST
ncbi:phosphatase 2A (PP2A) regulatory subunit-related protein [Skeletonema marinoi]|uniref:Phosphatase 2A (PP2A) regulatory subunit-related protein n=1 Tax=Skeletonema marinoi TaxID=267567 RepID=A0AAD8XY22_9STRA|nr:phosphatase 2A (PP2A) regulatory subunit-related protein [Skeletonema marinoi]